MSDTDCIKKESRVRGVPYAPGVPLTNAEEVNYFNASAGLWTTVEDYSLFARMLANNGSFKGRQYLKPTLSSRWHPTRSVHW
jgi:CubicO group peptidase (beta-lactamase class C family)